MLNLCLDNPAKFLEYLMTAKGKFKFYLYAWCLMDNHYHLLLETTQANISAITHSINTAYTTLNIAGQYGRVLQSEKGRARQMNTGAREARNDILLFLHADNVVSSGVIENIEKEIRRNTVL